MKAFEKDSKRHHQGWAKRRARLLIRQVALMPEDFVLGVSRICRIGYVHFIQSAVHQN